MPHQRPRAQPTGSGFGPGRTHGHATTPRSRPPHHNFFDAGDDQPTPVQAQHEPASTTGVLSRYIPPKSEPPHPKLTLTRNLRRKVHLLPGVRQPNPNTFGHWKPVDSKHPRYTMGKLVKLFCEEWVEFWSGPVTEGMKKK